MITSDDTHIFYPHVKNASSPIALLTQSAHNT